MAKSKLYKLAQFAVLRDEYLSAHDKLDVLRELMSREDLEQTWEKNREKENTNA